MNIQTLINRQFIVFIFGGVVSAVIDIGAMQLMIGAYINPLLAATSGFFLGLLFNFIYHAFVSFRSTMSLPRLARFLLVVGLNYVITMVLVYISLALLHQGALPGKILSLPVVAANGYLLSKYWVFR